MRGPGAALSRTTGLNEDGITGVDFARGWAGRLSARVAGLEVSFLGRAELIANKRATGRPKDIADLAELERS
jgi:hypothetical protein